MSKKVISFHYTLTNKAGEKLDSSQGGDAFTYLTSSGQIIAGLDGELQKLQVGDKKRIHLTAPDAYGVRDEKKVTKVPRSKMPSKEVKVGDRFRTGHDDHADIVTVTEVTAKHVTLDGNHPLAGEDLTFDVEVTASREATKEEIEHGHVHGAGGHHH